MRPPFSGTPGGLTITDALVLYRSLLSTRRIHPDPSQHRLAIHLQGLYSRLKDYEPHIEYAERLKQISRAINELQSPSSSGGSPDRGNVSGRRAFSSFLRPKQNDSLALTRVLSSHESALKQDSPRGLLVHGEVGTGKSMLIDLLADSLPTRKKKRWHFNTFMLETFARLERIRRTQNSLAMAASPTSIASLQAEEYSILQIVRDLIYTSPILFLDEFQLPDRATSRILSSMLTLFFQLGGVLVATSNRMPEELAEASGMEYSPSTYRSRTSDGPLSRIWRKSYAPGDPEKNDSLRFLEVLKARCEVWQMEGQSDWRRLESRNAGSEDARQVSGIGPSWADQTGTSSSQVEHQLDSSAARPFIHGQELPECYHISSSTEVNPIVRSLRDQAWERLLRNAVGRSEPVGELYTPIPWQPSHMQVYGRTVIIPRIHAGVSYWTFNELCASDLGPADYISLASRCHTLVLVDVPIISFLQRNEARRLITLLDALYEARCKLLVRAAAGPDDIFFPGSTRGIPTPSAPSAQQSAITQASTPTAPDNNKHKASTPTETDSVYSETFSEIHQDLTSPFRPNISSYSPGGQTAPVDPADEDSDFGPLHPGQTSAPDFTRGAGSFLGEDERFAYKRAESRLWEMCGSRWWARQDDDTHTNNGGASDGRTWWRPVPAEARHWERSPTTSSSSPSSSTSPSFSSSSTASLQDVASLPTESSSTPPPQDLANPIPTNRHPDPPRFSWVHAWGMIKWGKKAGRWGEGVDGLEKKK